MEDTILQEIQQRIEMKIDQLREQTQPGESWILFAPSELIHTYISLKMLGCLDSLKTQLEGKP